MTLGAHEAAEALMRKALAYRSLAHHANQLDLPNEVERALRIADEAEADARLFARGASRG